MYIGDIMTLSKNQGTRLSAHESSSLLCHKRLEHGSLSIQQVDIKRTDIWIASI